MGANGAAKSKPINILRGVHPADSGAVEIDGEAVDFRSPFEVCVRTLALQLAGVETGQQVVVPPMPIDKDIRNMDDLAAKLPQFSKADVSMASWIPEPKR
jgi:ABC-type branched-subunit amino acid transport system ATPase component